MPTLTLLLTIFLILFFLVIIITIIRNTYYSHPYDSGIGYNSHDETTIPTTTVTIVVDGDPVNSGSSHDDAIVGTLAVQIEGTQQYVIDPADSEKIWVNTSDNMYRDVDGKVWKLK